MAEAKVEMNASPVERALQLRESLVTLLPTLPVPYSEHLLASFENIFENYFCEHFIIFKLLI
jgi:hypothetical protein